MPAPLVKYAFFFTFDIFCFFVKDQVFEDVWIDIEVYYSVPLVLLSVLMPIPGCFQYCSSVVEFEVRDYDASRSSFIVQDWETPLLTAVESGLCQEKPPSN